MNNGVINVAKLTLVTKTYLQVKNPNYTFFNLIFYHLVRITIYMIFFSGESNKCRPGEFRFPSDNSNCYYISRKSNNVLNLDQHCRTAMKMDGSVDITSNEDFTFLKKILDNYSSGYKIFFKY